MVVSVALEGGGRARWPQKSTDLSGLVTRLRLALPETAETNCLLQVEPRVSEMIAGFASRQ